jgi:hypothetical protein
MRSQLVYKTPLLYRIFLGYDKNSTEPNVPEEEIIRFSQQYLPNLH